MSRRSTQRKPLQMFPTHNRDGMETAGIAPKAENSYVNNTKKEMPSPSKRQGAELQSKKTTLRMRASRTERENVLRLGVKEEADDGKQRQVGLASFDLPTAPASRKRLASPIKKNPTDKVLKLQPDDDDNQLSDSESEEELDYETMRERNMRDNEAFFSSLGIDMAKEHLKESTRKKLKPPQRRELKPKVVLPVRKSLRIQRINPAGESLPPDPELQPVVDEHPRLPAGPINMLDALEYDEPNRHTMLSSSVTKITTNTCSHEPLSSDLASFVSSMQKMHIRTKVKACKDRLFSVALHPTTDKVLAIAGDKWGRLGFWDINAADQDTSVVTYRPHSRPVCHIVVRPESPSKVYTCSYDATLRCGDIKKGVFQEVYSVPEEEEDMFRGFDFLSTSSLLLAQFRGFVSLLDIRSPGGKAEKKLAVSDKLRSISVHPTNNNFFCTASSGMTNPAHLGVSALKVACATENLTLLLKIGAYATENENSRTVCVWDLRAMSSSKGNKPLHTKMHAKAVSSAYFSPLTGSHILSCSTDDTLGVFNCSSSCGEVSYAKKISHNNHTGRWLTPFRAVWHPAREDVFFVGSMKTPRRIEAFGIDGRLLHNFDGEVLSSVSSVVQFHPSRNILVGGNSSGYIFPFM